MDTIRNDVKRPDWSVGLKVNLPPEYVLIHRVWLGGIGVLCQLDGDVPAFDVLYDHLPLFAESWDAGAEDPPEVAE